MRKRPLIDYVSDETWNKHCSVNYEYLTSYPSAKQFYKISVVTTCMNRLDDLKKTYLRNIESNVDYPNIEFVLLNYNSRDDLDTWVMKNLMKYQESHIFHYYKTEDPFWYSMAHSRNIAFKLATGDIVTSIDADHYIKPGFIAHLNTMANFLGENSVLVKSRQKNRGRITMFKNTFLKLGGYDEQLCDYGWEDMDLLCRAHKSGCRVVKYGGEWGGVIEDHKRHQNNTYKDDDWRYTQDRNTAISLFNLHSKRLVANRGSKWGHATVTKDFSGDEFDSCELSGQ